MPACYISFRIQHPFSIPFMSNTPSARRWSTTHLGILFNKQPPINTLLFINTKHASALLFNVNSSSKIYREGDAERYLELSSNSVMNASDSEHCGVTIFLMNLNWAIWQSSQQINITEISFDLFVITNRRLVIRFDH